jgi:hypothetical protein
MPADLKARVDAAAARNGRSINAECVARLQESFGALANVAPTPYPSGGIDRPAAPTLTDEDIDRIAARLAAKLKAL